MPRHWGGSSDLILICAAALSLAACDAKSSSGPAKAATAELLAHETELLKLTLSPQANRQLGIRTISVAAGAMADRLSVHGEVVIPSLAGSAPTGSSGDLATLATNQARAEGDVARARAEVAAARRAADRAAALVRAEAGSVRARDDAFATLAIANAALRTAQVQRALLGPAASSIGRQSNLWIRVPVLAADLPAVDRGATARVSSLGSQGAGIGARPVAGPPSADPAAGTVDLYYAVSGAPSLLRVGQRVAVELPVSGRRENGVVVPTSALLNDIYGGEWVYVASGPREYHRKRVEISGIEDGRALVARGLASGDKVITAGAAELFGTEFGAK